MRAHSVAAAIFVCLPGAVLADTPTFLAPVTVTASRTEHNTAEAPASVTVITAEEIRARGATNLLEAVRALPGITLSGRQVGGRKTLTIRGAEDRHTLVLVNGRRINSTDDVIGHSDYQYGWVPLEQVERIELVRGPMSALYGSEAVGGVINIITREAGKSWSGNASLRGDVGAGSSDGGDGYGASASLSGPLAEGLTLAFSFEDMRRSEVPSPEDKRLNEIEGRERRTATIDLTYEPVEGHEVFASFMTGTEDLWRGNVSRSVYYDDRYNIDRQQVSAGYRGDWNGVRPEIHITRSDFEVTSSRSHNVAATRPQTLRDDIVDGLVTMPIGDSHVVTAGGELRRETLWNNGLIGGEDSADHKAVYLQDEIALAEPLTLTLGVRNDHHEIFGNELSPRAYLVWRATPSLIVKGGYGQAFRAPTLKQISPSYVGAEGPHTFYGNADVKPETSESYEIGVDWRQGGTAASATLFRNEIDNLIYTRLQSQVGSRRFYIYDNISSARLQGVEAAVSQALPWGLTLSGNYMYLDATDLDSGETLTKRPKHSASATLSWTEGPWGAAVSGEYIGAQYLEGTSGNERVSGYGLVHLSGSYQLREDVRLRAGLRNLADVRLAEKSDLYGYAEEGRLVYFAIDASF